MVYFRYLVSLLACSTIGMSSWAQNDSVKVFTEDQLLWIVGKYHPIARQANLQPEIGKQELRSARGGFDPYVEADFDEKYYDNTEYYQLFSSGLKIPTWFGVELKGGYNQNQGVYLSPENNLPDDGQWYAGVSIPLGKNLFIDKRRAALRQAQIFSQQTESQRQQILNDLYFDAVKTYWKWVALGNLKQLYDSAVVVAYERLENVKETFELGDAPAIDTVEAHLQWQSRLMSQTDMQLTYQNQRLELSNFLWFEDNVPMEITNQLVPPEMSSTPQLPSLSQDSVRSLKDQIAEQHPEIKNIINNIEILEVEQRLKREYLKPSLNLEYNALQGVNQTGELGSITANDYKWGLSFKYPLFIRKERGDLQKTSLKIRETSFKKDSKQISLENKLQAYVNNHTVLSQQITLAGNMVLNYQRLLNSELTLFQTGESSLFLINNRELKLLESKEKLIDLNSKFQQNQAGILWSAGQLHNYIEIQ